MGKIKTIYSLSFTSACPSNGSAEADLQHPFERGMTWKNTFRRRITISFGDSCKELSFASLNTQMLIWLVHVYFDCWDAMKQNKSAHNGIPPDRWASRGRRAILFIKQYGITGLIERVRTYGIVNSFFYLKMHMRYQISIELGKRWDRKHNVNTRGQIDLDQVDVVGANKTEGHPIVSISPRTFSFLARHFPKTCENYTFIDIGSGKGRSLLMAQKYGFEKIIGVEFAEAVCLIAKDNIQRFRHGKGRVSSCHVVHLDATQYEYPYENLVLYFNNPFSPNVWEKIIPIIEASLQEKPRKIILIMAGSVPDKVEAVIEMMGRSPYFVIKATGIAPYYCDTYLPFYYAVYQTP